MKNEAICRLVEKMIAPAYPRLEVLSPGCMLESPVRFLIYTDVQVKPLPNQIRASGGGSLGMAIERRVFHMVLKWSQGWEPLL